uniref:acyl-homoserine-lactone synthase n=1 Tax=uncultured Sphingomonas sp. TaxID=158754 RepID=UPI0035CB415B
MHHLIHTPGQATDDHLRAMYEARKRVFVDLLKWDLPVLAERYELDQFDDEHARYLIIADVQGEHLASTRLLPTIRPHLIDSVFAALCDKAPPVGETIYEISRFCLDRRLRAPERREVRNILVRALVDQALAGGITTYTGVAELAWFEQIRDFGWDCSALGTPLPLPCGTLVALRIDITAETPFLLAWRGIGARPGPEMETRHAA